MLFKLIQKERISLNENLILTNTILIAQLKKLSITMEIIENNSNLN